MKKAIVLNFLSMEIHFSFNLFTFSFLLAASFLSAQAGWGPDTRLTYMQGGGRYPRAACCGDTIHLVWWQAYTGHDEIYYLRSADAGMTWSEPVRLTPEDSISATLPSIAVWGSNVHVVWKEQGVYYLAVCYRKSEDGGNNWGTIDTLYQTNQDGWYHPWIAAEENNVFMVAVKSGSGGELVFLKSTDNGNSWIAPQIISSATDRPHIEISKIDTLLLTVVYGDGSILEIYNVLSFNGGETWTNSQMVSEDDGVSSFNPAMTTDDSGGIHIDWCDYKYSPYPWTGDIFYRASRDSGNSWEEIDSLTVEHRAVASDILAQGNNLHLVWEDDRNGNFEIYYRQSTDLGQTWDPEIRLTNALNSSSRPSLACGGGYLHLFWQDARDDSIGARNAIYYKRKDLSGGITELKGDLSLGLDFGVFPNPFSRQINISIGRGYSAESKGERILVLPYA